MILVVSNARDVTADFFQDRLAERGVPYVRLNTETLAGLPLSFALDEGRSDAPRASFSVDGESIDLEHVGAVYYRRPVMPDIAAGTPAGMREWMENEIRRAWGGVLASDPSIRWMNHPIAISGASYKPEQLARAARAGFSVPSTIVTSSPSEAAAFCGRFSAGVVVKPIGHGEILGDREDEDYVVYTNLVDRGTTDFSRVAHCPTLFQRAIPKAVDIRATVAGNEVVAVTLHSQDRDESRVDCRRNNMAGMRYSPAALPSSLVRRLVELVRSYDLLFGAVDLVRDVGGEYWFVELNPAGQWAWLEQAAEAPISDALMRALTA